MKIGDAIKHLREQQDLTQEELAKKLNLSRSTISMYENNERIPNAYILDNIADALGVSVDYLIGRIDRRMNQRQKLHPAIKKTLQIMYSITDEGKEQILDYAEMLFESDRYSLPKIKKIAPVVHTFDLLDEFMEDFSEDLKKEEEK